MCVVVRPKLEGLLVETDQALPPDRQFDLALERSARKKVQVQLSF